MLALHPTTSPTSLSPFFFPTPPPVLLFFFFSPFFFTREISSRSMEDKKKEQPRLEMKGGGGNSGGGCGRWKIAAAMAVAAAIAVTRGNGGCRESVTDSIGIPSRFQDNTTTMQIDWPTRQRICIGVAKGLAFLHEESVIKMVHRDIKATNVLLDTDLTPKISDFGLAKLTEEENTHVTTKVAGTIGYMAPEYALRGTLTYKADVYSFGILALEIVAGKSNMKYRPNGDFICVLDWAADLEKRESLMDLVDPRLGNDLNKTEALRMVNIALLCTQKIPTLRPTMSEVVNMLEGTTKIMEPDINIISSEDEYRLQALRMLEEVEYGEHVSFRTPTSSSSHDLYPKSQISYD